MHAVKRCTPVTPTSLGAAKRPKRTQESIESLSGQFIQSTGRRPRRDINGPLGQDVIPLAVEAMTGRSCQSVESPGSAHARKFSVPAVMR
ncbi:hypothetical protein A4G27_20805 [Mycobacterium kansasii]|nr:hypothetical protein A4G27_20805 [Mycobacterium kansasii]